MKKTMKKQYHIRKRKNITNHKYKNHYGGFSPGNANNIMNEAENVLSYNNMNQNYTDPNMMMMGQNYTDPSMLYKLYGNPFKISSLWDLAVQPITIILSELYNILKTGSIKNPNELKTKLDNLANSIEDPDVKNMVLNYNSQIMYIYLNDINPSVNILSNVFSKPISKVLDNIIRNMYIYLIDTIKMTIINKQNQLVSTVLNQPRNIYYGLEFLNNNIVNMPSDNYNNRLYTDQFIQEGGKKHNETHNENHHETNKKNDKIKNELVNEINKSLLDYR